MIQAFAYIISTNIPLAKANHMATLSTNEAVRGEGKLFFFLSLSLSLFFLNVCFYKISKNLGQKLFLPWLRVLLGIAFLLVCFWQ